MLFSHLLIMVEVCILKYPYLHQFLQHPACVVNDKNCSLLIPYGWPQEFVILKFWEFSLSMGLAFDSAPPVESIESE